MLPSVNVEKHMSAGRITDYDGRGDVFVVSDAVITDQKLSADWDEAGECGHLEATSTDGIMFTGHYGYPSLDLRRSTLLKRYRSADGDTLFIGPWQNANNGREGTWFIVLTNARH